MFANMVCSGCAVLQSENATEPHPSRPAAVLLHRTPPYNVHAIIIERGILMLREGPRAELGLRVDQAAVFRAVVAGRPPPAVRSEVRPARTPPPPQAQGSCTPV